MPVGPCRENGRPGYRCGQAGKCYTYAPGDEAGRRRAKQKAVEQCLAMGEEPSANQAPTGEWLTAQLQRAHRHAERVEPHLAAAIEDALTRAGAGAADRFEKLAVSYLTAAAPTPRSTMVALFPTAEQAATLAVPGGEPAEILHVTLCYLGETVGPLTRVVDALRPVTARHAALTGVVAGAGYFRGGDDGVPWLALPSVLGLVELRVAVADALTNAGIDYSRDYGYVPHMTMAYTDAPVPPPAPFVGQDVTFGSVWVVRGDEERVELPLTGVPPLTAAARSRDAYLEDIRSVAEKHNPAAVGYGQVYWSFTENAVHWVCGDWTRDEEIAAAEADFLAIPEVEKFYSGAEENPTHWLRVYPENALSASAVPEPFWQSLRGAAEPQWIAPAVDELLPADHVINAILARTRPTRDAAVAATMTPVLESVGVSFDVTNPFIAPLLEATAVHVTEIADTTRNEVRRIVARSYAEGLSIPHAAAAIRAGMAEASVARSKLIARTELVGAVNGASAAAVQVVEDATGVRYTKQWMTAPGAKHPRHYLYDGLNGQSRRMTEAFDVGGSSLQYPGDPNGPAREVCNCRCAMDYREQR